MVFCVRVTLRSQIPVLWDVPKLNAECRIGQRRGLWDLLHRSLPLTASRLDLRISGEAPPVPTEPVPGVSSIGGAACTELKRMASRANE